MIPERLRAKVSDFPEVSMGANRVALVLRSGEVIEDVILAWGDEVVRVAGGPPPGLAMDDVIDVLDRSTAPRNR